MGGALSVFVARQGSSPFVRRSRQPVGDDVDVGAFLEDVSL